MKSATITATLPLFLAAVYAQDSEPSPTIAVSTMSVWWPTNNVDEQLDLLAGSIINIENARTTLAFGCADPDSESCGIPEPVTVTEGSDYFRMYSTTTDVGMSADYTLLAECNIASASATCTVSLDSDVARADWAGMECFSQSRLASDPAFDIDACTSTITTPPPASTTVIDMESATYLPVAVAAEQLASAGAAATTGTVTSTARSSRTGEGAESTATESSAEELSSTLATSRGSTTFFYCAIHHFADFGIGSSTNARPSNVVTEPASAAVASATGAAAGNGLGKASFAGFAGLLMAVFAL